MTRLRTLLAHRLRRDRVQVPIWVVGTGVLAVLTVVATVQSYGTEQDRTSLLATVIANPVILLFRGLPSGAGEGAFVAFLIVPFLAMLAAFMSSFLAVRHSRAEEESGRAELVAATPAGRMLPTVATIIHGTLANLALAALVALAFLGSGLDAAGALVAGGAAGGVGLVFLGVGLLASQLMRTSRAANAVGVAVLLVTYVVSGIGNALGTASSDLQSLESSWLTWLSPFGWAENSRPFGENHLLPLLLCLVCAAVLVAVSLLLQSARDLDASFIPERQGRRDARPALASSTALVWRLAYGGIVGWAIGAALTGLLASTLSSVVDQIGTQNPAVTNIIEKIGGQGSLQEAALATFFLLVGILAACAGVQIVTQARQQEVQGTTELLLARPVGRVRWLADHLIVGFCAIVIIVAAAVGAAALGTSAVGGPSSAMGDAVIAGAGQIAAASVFLVATALLFVAIPPLTISAGWAIVTLALIVGMFGPLFGMPDWAVHLSPFSNTPMVTSGAVDVRGLWWLTGVSVAGAIVALGGMTRREWASG